MRREKLGTFLALAGAATLVAAATLGLALSALREAATSPSPDPSGSLFVSDQQEGESEEPEESALWPKVDWDWWRSVNPDIVGWISIPGSGISQPIVQASPASPHFYLTHDVRGNWNPYGAIYLDAACANDGGLDTLLDQTERQAGSQQRAEDGSGNEQQQVRNLILYGHHCQDGSMFSAVAQYANATWAQDHPTVLLQTPKTRCVLNLDFASVVDNATHPKRTAFESNADWEAWYAEEKAAARVVVRDDERGSEAPQFTISLVTCSYRLFPDERTVAVTVPATYQ